MTLQIFTWAIPAIAIALIGIAFFAPRKEDRRTSGSQAALVEAAAPPLRITFAPAVFEPSPVVESAPEPLVHQSGDAWVDAYTAAGFDDAASAIAALAGGNVADGEALLRLAYADAKDAESREMVLRALRHGRWVLAGDVALDALLDAAPRVRSLAIDVFEAFGDSTGMRAALNDPLVPIAARAAFALSGVVAPDIYDAAIEGLDPARAALIRDALADAML